MLHTQSVGSHALAQDLRKAALCAVTVAFYRDSTRTKPRPIGGAPISTVPTLKGTPPTRLHALSLYTSSYTIAARKLSVPSRSRMNTPSTSIWSSLNPDNSTTPEEIPICRGVYDLAQPWAPSPLTESAASIQVDPLSPPNSRHPGTSISIEGQSSDAKSRKVVWKRLKRLLGTDSCVNAPENFSQMKQVQLCRHQVKHIRQFAAGLCPPPETGGRMATGRVLV